MTLLPRHGWRETETTVVGRGSPLNGRLVDGGTDGSNPSPSSGESGANLTLEAIPSVAVAKCGPSSGDTSMPQDAERALPILERAIALEPDYAVAHAIIAWCHEQRYLRGGSAAGWHPQLPATRQPTHLCIVVLSG